MNPLKFYTRMLEKYPMRTNVIGTGFLFGLGDVIAQTIFEDKHKPYDYRRTCNLLCMGAVFSAPVFLTWYNYLPRFCEKHIFARLAQHKSNIQLNVLQKTFISMSIDQTFFAFSFNCYFFMVINYIEYQSIDKGVTAIKEKLGEAMYANWKLWPAAQMINFSIVPIQYRVIFSSCVGLLWNVYLSWLQHRHQLQQEKAEEKIAEKAGGN